MIKINNAFFLTTMLLALFSCKTTMEFSGDLPMPRKSPIHSNHSDIEMNINWFARKTIAQGFDCPSMQPGLCLNFVSELADEEPRCFPKNENGILSIAIAQYNNEHTINPQFETLNRTNTLSIADSLVIWDYETLNALDFAHPIAVLPNDYLVTRSHDTLYVNLQTTPICLSKKVCFFLYYDDLFLENMQFQDYYDGFLGKSDVL